MQQRDLGGGAASSWNRPAARRVAERGLDRDQRRRGRGPAGEARAVDGEAGDGRLGRSLQPPRRRGRDGGDGRPRRALGAAAAAQRRPAAEEGGDDGRRRLAQRDGAGAGLVGVEQSTASNPPAPGRRAAATATGIGTRGRRRRSDGQPEPDGDHQRHARRRGQRGASPRPSGRSRRRPSSSSAGLRAGARITTSWPRCARARGERRPVVVRLVRAVPGVRRDEAEPHRAKGIRRGRVPMAPWRRGGGTRGGRARRLPRVRAAAGPGRRGSRARGSATSAPSRGRPRPCSRTAAWTSWRLARTGAPLVAGPDTAPPSVAVRPGAGVVVGVRFRIGRGAAVLGVPASRAAGSPGAARGALGPSVGSAGGRSGSSPRRRAMTGAGRWSGPWVRTGSRRRRAGCAGRRCRRRARRARAPSPSAAWPGRLAIGERQLLRRFERCRRLRPQDAAARVAHAAGACECRRAAGGPADDLAWLGVGRGLRRPGAHDARAGRASRAGRPAKLRQARGRGGGQSPTGVQISTRVPSGSRT